MQIIALVVHGISYTATLAADTAVVRRADGTLLGAITSDADAEALDACLPDALAQALDLARRLVAAEEAGAEAAQHAELRRRDGRRVAEAHWLMVALVHAIRADGYRAALADLGASSTVAQA